MKMKNFST